MKKICTFSEMDSPANMATLYDLGARRGARRARERFSRGVRFARSTRIRESLWPLESRRSSSRPFGVKEGVDFDAIDEKLIRPAINLAGFDGYTISKVIEAGNIREDMFGFLVTADIVIADLSIHNANVFYELGIRLRFTAARHRDDPHADR